MRRERVRAEQRVHTMLLWQDAAAHFSAARPSTERSPDHRVAQQPQLEQGDARRHVLLARALRRRIVEHERLRERQQRGAQELLGPLGLLLGAVRCNGHVRRLVAAVASVLLQ